MPTDSIRPSDISPDPIITQWAVQYGSGPGFVADDVAPVIDVAKPEFKFMTFKAEELNDEIDTVVVGSDRPNQVRRGKPTFTTKSCQRQALDDFISDETMKQSPNGVLTEEKRTAKMVQALRLGYERRVKALLDSSGNAQTAPSTKWDATSGTIKIEEAFDKAREAHLIACGREANLALIPPAVARVMKRDTTLRGWRQYTDPSLLVNGDLPPTLWGLRFVVPGALVNTGAAKADFSQTIARVWSTDTVYLLTIDSLADLESFTALAQARWSEWGTPFAGYRWRDSHMSVRGTWLSVEAYQTEFLVCGDAITRIPDVLT